MAEQNETGTLIGSDKVEGTNVYGTGDEKIGSIERVMIDKTTGQVSYAVLAFGGFLGIGEDHYPVPWNNLTYDTNLGGYRTHISKQQLEGAPKYRDKTIGTGTTQPGSPVFVTIMAWGELFSRSQLSARPPD